MDFGQILSWLVGAVGLTGFYFAGKKVWWSWYINLVCQILWIAYALVTGYLAFLVTAAVYSIIFARNAYLWTKEHRNKPVESNLVKHTRHELELIGEDPEVIEWYLNVIREYASFGHSGGSAWATTAVLEKLLRFQPLTELTNDPKEWYHHGPDKWGGTNGIWQNKRDGRAFSEDGGETYYLVDDPEKTIRTTACNICSGPNRVATNQKCLGCGRDFAERIRADL